jgi:hypothetical protein
MECAISLQAGGITMLLEQLNSYKSDITAIQELRWVGKGVMENHINMFSLQFTPFLQSQEVKPPFIV